MFLQSDVSSVKQNQKTHVHMKQTIQEIDTTLEYSI